MNILITGAAGGMGYASAKIFAERGYKVYGIDLNTPEIIPNGTEYYSADVTDPASLEKVAETLCGKGIKLDGIINFAGIYFMDNFIEVDEKRLEKIFKINVLGTIYVNKTFFGLLNKNARIIITTSEVAATDPLPFNGIYATTKTALDAYAKAFAQEAGLLGVKVVTVRPGAVNTALARSSFPSMREMAEKSEFFGGQAEKFEKIMKKFAGKPISAETLAQKIYKIYNKKRPKSIYSVHTSFLLKLFSALPLKTQKFIIRKLIG